MNKPLYLHSLTLPNIEQENDFISKHYFKGSYHASYYPFGIFPTRGLKDVVFSPVTILCGDNGTGKSTLLNVLAQRLDMRHESPYNDSPYMGEYVNMCSCDFNYQTPPWHMQIITSDDVFNRSFHRREMNMVTHDLQTKVLEEGREMLQDKNIHVNFDDPDDVARFKRKSIALGKHGSYSGPHKLVMKEVGRDIILHSNGENALEYFEQEFRPHGLYLLDEPENSLSIARQLILKQYIESMVQEEFCQFVIATHSPFLLAIEGATIYNMDDNPVSTPHWTNIENVRAYFQFFKDYESQFEHPLTDDQPTQLDDTPAKAFRDLLTRQGYTWKYIEHLLGELRYPNRINEFLAWAKEYSQIYAGLFPTEDEIVSCINYICFEQERPPIEK